MRMKKVAALTLTTLTLCIVLSVCGSSTAESKSEDSTPISGSAEKMDSKLVAGLLEQNSVERK
ncbi:hypothetical protein V6615_01100 [Oscillospiraceae bacterium PP1C4]